jgi:dTDP-glucose 4,6-dehydratase
MKLLVTGGCGFIGSHVIDALILDGHEVINLDALTYAADPANNAAVAGSPRYRFVHGNICDAALVADLVNEVDVVVNFAAETHVDRSLHDPVPFVRTDVEGVAVLLEAVRRRPGLRLVHMSTDEVFGSLPPGVEADVNRPFAPASPYAASKAAAELLIAAYRHTYGLPITVIRACNLYGPRQHPEKFIPLFITQALRREPMPLYGDGLQEREWLYIDDFVDAFRRVLAALDGGPLVVHVASGQRLPNRRIAELICGLTGAPLSLIHPVADRPGHDRRYALDASTARALGWAPKVPLEEGLARTVEWYRVHGRSRLEREEYRRWFVAQYAERLGAGKGGESG